MKNQNKICNNRFLDCGFVTAMCGLNLCLDKNKKEDKLWTNYYTFYHL